MNQRISVFLFSISLLLLLFNHYWYNWENHAIRKVEKNLTELILSQRTDLIGWSENKSTDPLFRKRTICDGQLIKWSDDKPFEYSNSSDSISVIENTNGFYLCQSYTNNDCVFLSIYPLYQKYSIKNQYLQDERGNKLTHHIKAVSIQGDYAFKNLLYYSLKPNPSPLIDGIIGGIFLLVLVIEYIRYSRRSISFFMWATGILLSLRLLSLQFEVLDLLFRFSLFDPIHFTSSFFNPTLGDLLVNAILLLLIAIFFVSHLSKAQSAKKSVWISLILTAISLSLLIFHIPWSILNNSLISLDVGESIKFDLKRIVAYVCILLICTTYFLLIFHIRSYFHRIKKLNTAINVLMVTATLIALFNWYLSLPLFLAVLFFVSSRWYDWEIALSEFSYKNLLFIFFFACSVGAILSFYIYKHSERDELFEKQKFANYLLLKRDVLSEFFLSKKIDEIVNNDSFELLASEGSRSTLENALLEKFKGPQFHKYSVDILFQDYQRLKVDTKFTREIGLLNESNLSDYSNIHFVDQGNDFKYVARLSLGDLVTLIVFRLKKRVPSTVYPALLTDSKLISISNQFDYAVFAGDEILFQRSKFGQGEWPSQNDFDSEKMYRSGIEKNGRHYYGVKTQDGRIILIISKKYSIRALLANFSFTFLLLLFAASLLSAIMVFLTQKKAEVTFTNKIQIYLSLAFIIPLLSTGFALLSTLNSSYKEEINRSYLKKALYISELLSEKLESSTGKLINESTLDDVSNYIESDISFYNAKGNLISTSQSDIFSFSLQSNLINPIVFEELISKENQSMIADESIGRLEYKVCYATVNTTEGNVAGFIAMPFFNSKNHLRRQQIDVFDNLIIIFGFVFIVAILLGNFVLNNLMQPLRMVAGKIRHVTLQEVNKPIKYASTDEIGSLVKDYNQMLVKLEESKAALAKSQKEAAWKEIAKQVAHEIKNPLTPMQLKIQQMLRRFDPESKEHHSLSSLLTQVDTLSQIAQSFSAFAEMPAPSNQVFDLRNLVLEVVSLYKSDKVVLEFDGDSANIEADKDIFRRILNNVVLNAIQSVVDSTPVIEIKLKRGDKAILSVRDNGKGINEDIRDKIFLNYFSTKSTGSGIGLALAKKGIENAGGNIWFESSEKGTIFYISMPLVD